jgi:hypothetical protein
MMKKNKTIKKVSRGPRFYTGALKNPKDNRDIPYAKVAQAISLPSKHITDITMIPVWHQGYLGTCVAHAIEFVKMFQEHKETGKLIPFSRRFLYSIAWKLGHFAQGQQGLYPRDGAKTANNPGNYPNDSIDDNTLPHEVYVSLETTDAMKKEAEPYRTGFAFLKNGDLNEIKTAVVREGVFTLSMGFNAQAGWDTGKLTKPKTIDSLHYIVIYGYEDTPDGTILYFRNSWGKEWGNNGCGQFNFKDYKTFSYDGIVFTDVPNKLIEEARATAYQFTKNLRKGDKNYDVQKLQERLRDEGFYNYPEVTGYFGTITEQAVKDYQTAKKIKPVSGYVGPLTRESLNAQKKKSLASRIKDFLS